MDTKIEITIDKKCPFCGAANSVTANLKDYKAWQQGTLIQDAMPYLSVDDRELFITGVCSSCWNKQELLK